VALSDDHSFEFSDAPIHLIFASICIIFMHCFTSTVQAGSAVPVVKAFYVKKLPDTYIAQEKFFFVLHVHGDQYRDHGTSAHGK
jgi:hypothetical protein